MSDELNIRSSPLVGLGSAALFTSGLLTGATGLQLLLASASFSFTLISLFVLGVGLLKMLFGGLIFKPRLWAITVATGLAIFAALFMALFNVFMLFNAVFTPLALLAGAATFPALLCVGVSIPAHLRISKARDALYA